MPGNQIKESSRVYLRIVGGNIVQTVPEGTEGSRRRDYELKDGTKGSKNELVFSNWEAVINNITVRDGEYGEECIIEFEDAQLTIPTSSRYFQDFACKIFNVDFKKPVKLHPYDIEVDNGRKTGISVQQDGIKLTSFFYDFEKKTKLNGFPEVDESKKDKKTYWKIYFLEVTEFLIEKIKTLKFENKKETKKITNINVEEEFLDLPF